MYFEILYYLFLGGSTIDSIDQILDDLGAYVFLDKIAKQLAKHPFLAFGASVLIISITLPFIIFLIFAIVTVIVTFFGFVIVEGKNIFLNHFHQQTEQYCHFVGTLITVASVALFGFLGAVVILFLLFGSVIMAGYFGFMQIYDLVYPQNLYIKFRQAPRHQHSHVHHHHTLNTRSLDGHST